MPSSPPLPIPAWLTQWFEEKVRPWIGAVLLFAVFRIVLEEAVHAHWILGLAATVVMAGLLSLLLVGLRRKLHAKYSHTMAGSMLLTTACLAIAVFASASMLVYHLDPQSYAGRSPVSMGTLADYYSWHAVDALPGLALWSSFQISRPLEHHGVLAGLCLFLFRVVVLGTLLTALKEWLARPRLAPAEKS